MRMAQLSQIRTMTFTRFGRLVTRLDMPPHITKRHKSTDNWVLSIALCRDVLPTRVGISVNTHQKLKNGMVEFFLTMVSYITFAPLSNGINR